GKVLPAKRGGTAPEGKTPADAPCQCETDDTADGSARLARARTTGTVGGDALEQHPPQQPRKLPPALARLEVRRRRPHRCRLRVVPEPERVGRDREAAAHHRLVDAVEHEGVVHPAEA